MLPEEEVKPTLAKKVGILTLLTVCDGLQKIVRERHLFILDGETMGCFFFLCLVLSMVKLQHSPEMSVSREAMMI